MVQLVQFSQKTEDMFWETSLTFKYVLPINVKCWNQCNIPRISFYVAWELCNYVSTYILNISSMSNQLNPYYSGNWKLMDSLHFSPLLSQMTFIRFENQGMSLIKKMEWLDNSRSCYGVSLKEIMRKRRNVKEKMKLRK